MTSPNSFEDKVVLITGSTSGIGKFTALELAKLFSPIILVSRTESKLRAVQSEIRDLTDNSNIDYFVCDFSSLDSIRRFADAFSRSYDRLDILINNHGSVFHRRFTSSDGFELTFATNHLGYFLTTHLLLDFLKHNSSARIINVSSTAHRMVRRLRLDDYNWLSRRYRPFLAYAESKLYNLFLTYELSRRLSSSSITVNALHPGFVRSNFGRNIPFYGLAYLFLRPFTIGVDKGAQTSIFLASSPDVEGVTGKYFVKKKAVPSSPLSYNEAAWRELWDLSVSLTGL